MSLREWRPFKLTFNMAVPIAVSYPFIHLDGIIAHLIHQRILGREFLNLPAKEVVSLRQDQKGKFKRTLAHTFSGVNKASVGFYADGHMYGTQRYFKRTEMDGMPGKQKLVTGNGLFRCWAMSTVYVSTPTLTFFGRGNPRLITDLLEDLTHIGDNVRMGWGKIRSAVFEEVREDWSLVRNGIAQRPLPVRLLSFWEDAAMMAARPPYWDPKAVELCAVPGSRVVLNPDASPDRNKGEEA